MLKYSLLVLYSFLASTCVQAQFWTQVDSDFNVTSTGISRFAIVDENIAWGIGYNGINPSFNLQQFSKTTDGGITWQAGFFNVGNTGLGIGDISAIDAQTALIAVYPRAAGQQGGVWKTIDGGVTWVQKTNTAYTNAASFTNTLHFFNAVEGVVIGDPINGMWEIYITSDGGENFTPIDSSAIPAPLANETGYIAQKAVVGSSIWFTTSQGRIYHSIDMGNNWNVYQSPITDFGGATVSGDLSFSDLNKGIIQTQAGILFKTLNAGQSWSQITTSGSGNPYGDSIAYVPNTSSLVSVGSSTGFTGSSYSLDDGITWVNIDAIQHVDIALFNPTTGYSGGFTNNSDTAGVFTISSNVLDRSLSSREFASAKAISLYPNPSNDKIQISSVEAVIQLELLNLGGQCIRQKMNSNTLSLDGVADGLYLVKIKTQQGTATLPVIKN